MGGKVGKGKMETGNNVYVMIPRYFLYMRNDFMETMNEVNNSNH